ncbi:hypothetical protein DI09_2p120 [Mitosporidium daphniae]|uniref:AMMECR1 domain-containing protein n=1 Tax=Mitosporidium daphniae TaxID=1485682 RepID=A0A098VRN5_9MICR|nr:uncharacterized protein DI09_2p120 [Mitosporidium daphniae]KGG51635.1 hypothetical protein DI09_2p120 [Mitosporidium daphniae]|eukprot:XP_013238062.1 uncharacterized protein DI09_2p120 [Mitosporidium daphniae]
MASDDPFQLLPFVAFEAILVHLKVTQESLIDTKALTTHEYPIFVSWYSGNGALRGCIGTFKSCSLSKAIRIFSIKSAFEDCRFSGISIAEVETLSCQVSVLVDFEPALHAFDWEDGVHGLQISFSFEKQSYTSTFLPNVSTLQGWSPMETIHQLIRKT